MVRALSSATAKARLDAFRVQHDLMTKGAQQQFMSRQLSPLMRGLGFTGAAGYAVGWAVTASIGPSLAPALPKVIVLSILTIVSLVTLPSFAPRPSTVAGWLCLAALQAGILLNVIGLPNEFGWLLPSFVLVTVGSSAAWLNTRDFVISQLICLAGPLVAWWLLRPVGAVVLQGAMFLSFAIATAAVVHVFTQWHLRAQMVLEQSLLGMAYTDTLTGVATRGHFFAIGKDLVAQAQRGQTSLCALYIDVDRFKSINDHFGHAAGDAALVEVTNTLRTRMREADFLGRVGGEEFAMLLPGMGLEQGTQLAERLRTEISKLDMNCGTLSISVGVAMLHGDTQSLDGILATADHALRRAKRNGRNRVEVAQTHA